MQMKGRAEAVDVIAVAALSLLATVPLFFVDPAVAGIVGGDVVSLLMAAVPFLLLLPLPAAYVASISRERFRVESLAAAAVLPLGFLGMKFGATAIGLLLGLPLVSYKARSIYTGDNPFWAWFKASAALITVLAVVFGLTAAYTYESSAPLREDVQGNLTSRAVDTATEFIDLSQQGVSSDRLTGAAVRISRNISRTSIRLTEQNVFAAVDADGTFSDQQRQVLRSAFTQSEQEIPSQLSEQARQQVSSQLGGQEDIQRDLIASRTGPIVEKLSQPTLPVLAVIFFTVLSLVYLLRFPLALLGGIYGTVFRRIRSWYGQRGESEGGDAGGRRRQQERRERGRRRP